MRCAYEHLAVLHAPDKFNQSSFIRSCGGKLNSGAKGLTVDVPETVDVIIGQLSEGAGDLPQSLRFSKDDWSEEEARAWLKENGIEPIEFYEAAAPKGKRQEMDIPVSAMMFNEAQLGIEIEQFKDGDQKKLRIKANSGGIMQHWLWGNFAIDMTGVQIRKQRLPLLWDHDTNRIIGWTQKITRDEKSGIVAEGVFSKTTEEGKRAMELTEEGFPWQASIYIPPSAIERVEAGQSVMVNGRKLSGPGTVFRKSRLREVTLTALGVDEDTSASTLSAKSETVKAVLTETKPEPPAQQQEDAMDYSKLTLEEIKTNRPDLANSLSAENKTAADEAVAAALKVERKRVQDIMTSAAALQLPDMGMKLANEGLAFEEAQAKLNAERLRLNAEEAPGSTGGGSGSEELTPEQLSSLPIDERCKKEWEAKAELRQEFGSFDVYLAFAKRAQSGQAQILQKK